MICFIDSYEWVMVANVMGMSQYSAESIKMMSRPYFSSANYIKNMSNFKLGSYEQITLNGKKYYWDEIWTALYYNFINKHKQILKQIYAIARNVSHWDKMSLDDRRKLLKIAKLYFETY